MKTAKQNSKILTQSQGYGDHGGWIAFRVYNLDFIEPDYGPNYMGGTEQEAIDNLLADEAMEAHREFVLSLKDLMGDMDYKMMIEGV